MCFICTSLTYTGKCIAASLYTVFLAVVLTVPTMTILDDDVNMTFVIPGLVIVLVNTCVLCLNFVPKVHFNNYVN